MPRNLSFLNHPGNRPRIIWISLQTIVIVLFAALFYQGTAYFGLYRTPVLLLMLGLMAFLIPVFNLEPISNKLFLPNKERLWLLAIVFVALLSGWEELRKIWVTYPLPTPNSDVIQQLQYQCSRFAHHQQPYHPYPDFSWHPFPVYMPLHWMPIGLGQLFDFDVRWSAYLVFVVCTLIYTYQVSAINRPLLIRFLMALLPVAVLWYHILFLPDDLAVSPEMLIGGYYLLVAGALLTRNHWLLSVGIACCLLSRFTLFFWLPLLAVVYWKEYGFKKLMRLAAIPTVALLALYVVPFLLKDPGIFMQGIAYHNGCAINDFTPVSAEIPAGWNATYGVSGLIYFNAWFPEGGLEAVSHTRALQGGIMLFLNLIGIVLAWRWKKASAEDILLLFLFVIVFCFFWFSPMTFRYYFFTVFILMAVLLARLMAGVHLSKTG